MLEAPYEKGGKRFAFQGDGYYVKSPQEMRAVLHRDRVRVRIVRYDRKGRPEGRVIDIVERRKSPIIGRLLHENGAWLVAPEDKRYGQDILIPKNATASAAVGQVVWVPDEAQLDAVTAVSGSGPAYFFAVMEAMEQAGVALGNLFATNDAREGAAAFAEKRKPNWTGT